MRDEEELVRLVAKGDRAAFEQLYRRTSPWLAVRLRRRCSDDQIVAEVLQETYLAVWRAAGSFAGAAVRCRVAVDDRGAAARGRVPQTGQGCRGTTHSRTGRPRGRGRGTVRSGR
jgi:hypothetical protein